MENSKSFTLSALDEFAKSNSKDIPKDLEEYLKYVASFGDPIFDWTNIKPLFRQKLLNVMDFETFPVTDIPVNPNSDPFNFESVKARLLERYDQFSGVPFTIQRMAELLATPRKQYNRLDKYMRALEKNIWVVSTRDLSREADSKEQNSIMNGMLSTSCTSPERLKRQSESIDTEEVQDNEPLITSNGGPTDTIEETASTSSNTPSPSSEAPTESPAQEISASVSESPHADPVPDINDEQLQETNDRLANEEESSVKNSEDSEQVSEPSHDDESREDPETEIPVEPVKTEKVEVEEVTDAAEEVDSSLAGIVTEPEGEAETPKEDERPDLKRKREEADDREDQTPTKKLETEVVIEETEPDAVDEVVNSESVTPAVEEVKESIIVSVLEDLVEEAEKEEGEMIVEEPVDQAMEVDESSADVQSPMAEEEPLEPMEASESYNS